MSVLVREAQPADKAIIATLIQEHAATSGESSPLTEDYVAEYLASSRSYILLAEEHDCVIGLLSYSVRPDLHHAGNSGLIEELIVRDSDRNRGVGSALMSELLRRLESIDCAEVSVSTMPDNRASQRFYHRHGLVDEAIFLEKHWPFHPATGNH